MSDPDDLKALLQACEPVILDDEDDYFDPEDEEIVEAPPRDDFVQVNVFPEHYRLPQHKRSSVPDPYASVRRLEHPLLLHMPRDILTHIHAVEQACPHARHAIKAMAQADLKRLEWGITGSAQPVLLVGPPGSGKSTVARLYYQTLGYEVMTINVGAMPDSLSLTGTHQTFGDAKPSVIVECLAMTGVANPCIILDEVDKPPKDGRHGSVQDALLPLLDMREARTFRDFFLNVSVDTSHIRWVLTANDISKVTAPLKSRCRIIHMDRPEVDHVHALAQNILRQMEEDRNLRPGWFGLDGMEMELLRQHFSGDMRVLRRMVELVVDNQVKHWPTC